MEPDFDKVLREQGWTAAIAALETYIREDYKTRIRLPEVQRTIAQHAPAISGYFWGKWF